VLRNEAARFRIFLQTTGRRIYGAFAAFLIVDNGSERLAAPTCWRRRQR